MLQKPILTILRGIQEKDLEPIYQLLIDAKLDTLEITMNTPQAYTLIAKMRNIAGDKLTLGAGTVLDMNDLDDALNAGASFIVTPNLNEEVISFCVTNHIHVFPGALTPSEVYKAWDLGASMVKLFPASCFGPKYIKDLKGPFDSIDLMAVGGVNAKNIVDYFKAGAAAVAIGGSIFKQEWLDAGRFELIAKELYDLCSQISIS